jgi:hypothetical protein
LAGASTRCFGDPIVFQISPSNLSNYTIKENSIIVGSSSNATVIDVLPLNCMLSIVFFIFAAICNAIMDVSSFHYSKSIFRSNKANFRYWWDGEISWLNKYIDRDFLEGRIKWNIFGIKINKPVQITDAFHFFKMFMTSWLFVFLRFFHFICLNSLGLIRNNGD